MVYYRRAFLIYTTRAIVAEINKYRAKTQPPTHTRAHAFMFGCVRVRIMCTAVQIYYAVAESRLRADNGPDDKTAKQECA